MKNTKNKSNALIAELRKNAENKSKLEATKAVAQATKAETKTMTHAELLHAIVKNDKLLEATQKTSLDKLLKKREVKDFISKNVSHDAILKDTRATVRQERAYMISQVAQDNFNVFNRTMFKNDKNELELFTQQKCNEKCLEILQAFVKDTKFSTSAFITKLQTCGGAYGDKIRKFLFSVSLYYSDALDTATLEKARELKKLCVYTNINSDSARKIYEFIKL